MKKKLLLILLFSTFVCGAQNYQCLQAGVKHYFTNGNGYLRGIRIDSVRMMGDTTVYYPFHTPRGNYNSTGLPVVLDSTGGSWLGGKVLQLGDGTFIFDDDWNDSVIIRTQANLTDSWIFYRDTSSLHYVATVVSIDTMTFAGFFDTVKTIQISAYDGTVLVVSDIVNGFQIKLSKNHGFIQVFDLYTFPYHLPNANYSHGLDYYLDNCINLQGAYSGYLSLPYSYEPNQNNSIFNLVRFIDPTNKQLNNWNIGDVYEYTKCSPDIYENPNCDPPMQYFLDTVKVKDTTAYNVQYAFTGLVSNIENLYLVLYTGGTPFYATAGSEGGSSYDTSMLIDTTLMPEEFNQTNLYYYSPGDTTLCMHSTLYASAGNLLNGVTYEPVFESTPPIACYKMNLGLVYYNRLSDDAGTFVTSTQLIYYYRDGESCGGFVDLSALPTDVKNVTRENSITIFPNPATSTLTIQSTNAPVNNISITNVLGQTVYTQECNAQQIDVDVSALAAAVYFVKVNGSAVRKFVKE